MAVQFTRSKQAAGRVHGQQRVRPFGLLQAEGLLQASGLLQAEGRQHGHWNTTAHICETHHLLQPRCALLPPFFPCFLLAGLLLAGCHPSHPADPYPTSPPGWALQTLLHTSGWLG